MPIPQGCLRGNGGGETRSLAQNFGKNLETVKDMFSLEQTKTLRDISFDIVEFKSVVGKTVVGASRVNALGVKYKPIYIAS